MVTTNDYRMIVSLAAAITAGLVASTTFAAPKDRPLAQRLRGALQKAEETAEQRGRLRFRAQPRAGQPPANATPTMPKVLLTNRDQKLCKVKVGDVLPAFELPKLGSNVNEKVKLANVLGKRGTVVVFWRSDRRASRAELADLGPEVVEPFGKGGVEVVGVAVQESPETATQALAKAGAKIANLIDADGRAFSQVGSECLPRTYVLDASGKIVWFDIAYSLATRRDLNTALRVLTEAK